MIEDRYGQGLEWFEIMSRIYTEPAPFDFRGRTTICAACRVNRGRCRRRGRSH